MGREGLADEAPLHAFETVCAASEAHVLSGAVTRSVAQDPFGGLTGWRSRRPRLPHLWSLPRSRLELHAPSITTVQDPRRPSAYSEDVSAESVRAFLASAAPDLEIVELPASSQTHTLSAAWGIRAAQIAKTLALSVGGRAVLAVVCGDSRLDNKKVKAVLGGKATMLAPEEAATITGHVLGGVCPFGLATPMPIYCDLQLRAFDEVVPGAGSTHTAPRNAPPPHAAPSRAPWGGICVVTTGSLADSPDGRR